MRKMIYGVKFKAKHRYRYTYKVYYSSTNVEKGWILMDSYREIRNLTQQKGLEIGLNDYLGNAAKAVIRDVELVRKYRVG